jgi:hypothetical protein
VEFLLKLSGLCDERVFPVISEFVEAWQTSLYQSRSAS